MTAPASDMLAEVAEAPDTLRRLFERQAPAIAHAVRLFADLRPRVVTTAARGSSDHAANFFKYLMETQTGLPVASIGPSVASVYDGEFQLDGALHLSVSQSGASPDLLATQAAARRGGATTIAVVNAADSPLAAQADHVIALEAGAERSVAATKSFIASAAVLAALVARIAGSRHLDEALARLPEALEAAAAPDPACVDTLARASSLFVVGRGPAFALAGETALKFKELAGLHAEPFSLAEVMHGPLSLVGPGFPVVGLIPDDGAMAHHARAIQRLADLGAELHLFTAADLPGHRYGMARTGHPAIDALSSMGDVYRLTHAVAVKRGLDPETPRNLSKVTRTA